jgi:hypothetical protein
LTAAAAALHDTHPSPHVRGVHERGCDVGIGHQVDANTGSASFVSDPAGGACPGFTATSVVSCALETMHVHFTAQAASGSGGAGQSQASLTTDVDVPAMRLKFTP